MCRVHDGRDGPKRRVQFFFFPLIAILSSVAGCGPAKAPALPAPPEYVPLTSPEMSWLVGDWEGTSGNQTKRISVSAKPSTMAYEWHMSQVGSSDNPALPVPTLCSYRYSASTFGVKRGATGTDATGDYTMVSEVNQFQLLPDPGVSSQCAVFQTNEEQNITTNLYIFNFSKGSQDELIEDGWVLHRVTASSSARKARR